MRFKNLVKVIVKSEEKKIIKYTNILSINKLSEKISTNQKIGLGQIYQKTQTGSGQVGTLLVMGQVIHKVRCSRLLFLLF